MIETLLNVLMGILLIAMLVWLFLFYPIMLILVAVTIVGLGIYVWTEYSSNKTSAKE